MAVDFLYSQIDVGDYFFYGNPVVVGQVIEIKNTAIIIEYRARWNHAIVLRMKIRDPQKGLCITKIPMEDFK